MLYIRIELWPWGDRDRRKCLGEMIVYNDTTGSSSHGNYRVFHRTEPQDLLDNTEKPEKSLRIQQFISKSKKKTVHVKGHDRSLSVWDLILQALKASGYKGSKK